MSEYLSVEEFATKLNVSKESVRRWIRAGKLQAAKVAGSREFRIPAAEALPKVFVQRQATSIDEFVDSIG
jgi:excisionase family DNA binding protein